MFLRNYTLSDLLVPPQFNHKDGPWLSLVATLSVLPKPGLARPSPTPFQPSSTSMLKLSFLQATVPSSSSSLRLVNSQSKSNKSAPSLENLLASATLASMVVYHEVAKFVTLLVVSKSASPHQDD